MRRKDFQYLSKRAGSYLCFAVVMYCSACAPRSVGLCTFNGSSVHVRHESHASDQFRRRVEQIPEDRFAFSRGPDRFLDELCSEYRDRPEIIDDRARTFSEFIILRDEARAYSAEQPVWEQVTADDYRLLEQFFSISAPGTDRERGNGIKPLLSECDLRFFLQNSRSNRVPRNADELRRYAVQRDAFLNSALSSRQCSAEELDTVLLFRGEGILWPTSGEASAMRNAGRYYREGCRSGQISKQDCIRYSRMPFAIRENFARGALEALLNYPTKALASIGGSAIIPRFLLEDLDGDEVPEAARLNLQTSEGRALWNALARYANGLAGDSRTEITERREHLREAVRRIGARQTGVEIYRSQVAGGLPFERQTSAARAFSLAELFKAHYSYLQLYYLSLNTGFVGLLHSPLISATSDLSVAQRFAFRGAALSRPRSPEMRWMFVFRLPRGAIVTKSDVDSGVLPDWRNAWFDQRSFGFEGAKAEKEFNAFGHPEAFRKAVLLWLGEAQAAPTLSVKSKKH